MIRALLTSLFFLISFAAEASSMPLTVFKSGNALYIWSAGFRAGSSKVWRLQVNNTPSATESGVVDFLGERLIPASTPATVATFFAAYNSPSEVIRYGDEESPPVYMAESGGSIGYMGGNHRVGSYDTVSTYNLTIALDGETPPENIFKPGNELVLTERYGVNIGSASDFPIIAQVTNVWKWDGSDFCRFEHRLTALKPITLGWWGGVQFQKLNVSPGRTLHLYVPGSTTYGSTLDGVDITSETTPIEINSADWVDANSPPSRFETFVKAGGVPQFTFIMAYDEGMYRGDMETALTRSQHGKIYPHGVDFPTPLEMRPGQSFSVSGHFGTYNGR